jgi:polysulfide reductase-like protein
MTSTEDEVRSYYGRPIVKPPVWKPEVPLYFFCGGVAGASSLLALGARLSGNEPLRRRAAVVSGLGVSVSPVLLIRDLGRPARFHHMLRVFKVTSPMNVGSWLLTAAGTASGTAAATELLGVLPRVGRAAEVTAGVLGAPLATYTGAIVANTAIPVWHEARYELPLSFGASGAAAAGGIVAAVTPARYARPARRLALAGAAAELAAAAVMERRLGDLAEPYRTGAGGRFTKGAKVANVAGLVLVLLAGGRRRPIAGGMLLALGSLLHRFGVWKAGVQAAEDPRYTIRQQRERLDRGEGIRTEPRRVQQPPATEAGPG